MKPPSFNFQMPGEMGTFQTINLMRSLVNKSFWHPWIIERAALLVIKCNRNRQCENSAITNWVHRNVSFIRDPFNLEALHDPVTFYEARLREGMEVWGDCDDLSVYLASLLKAIGHNPRFRVIAGRRAGTFDHVHVACEFDLLDASMPTGTYPRVVNKAVQVDI